MAAQGQNPRLQQLHASGQTPATANAPAWKRSAVQSAGGVRGPAPSSTNAAVFKHLGADAARFNMLFLNSALELLGVPDTPPKQLSSAAAVPPAANKAVHRYAITSSSNRNRSSTDNHNKIPAGPHGQHRAWNRNSTACSYHRGYSSCSTGPQQLSLDSRSAAAAAAAAAGEAAAAAAGEAAAPLVPATSSLRMGSL